MTQFHEGQDVEVAVSIGDAYDAPMSTAREWRKAKIVGPISDRSIMVEFPDDSRAVFDAGHIRARGVIIVDSTIGYAGD